MSNVSLHRASANAITLLKPGWKPREKGGGLVMGVELETEPQPRGFDDKRIDSLCVKYRQQIIEAVGYAPTGSPVTKAGARQFGLIEDVVGRVGSDFIIAKRDGSLEYGAEFVSRPADLYTQLRRWGKLFADAPESFGVSKRCGLHVHVGKHNLTPSQIGQAIALTTEPSYNQWVVELAGRKSEQWANLVCKTKNYYASSGKYEAVNTTPSSTIEFRLFAATTVQSEFNRRLEYVHAVLTWSKEMDLDQATISTKGLELFVGWLEDQPAARYTSLREWVKDTARPQPKSVEELVAEAEVANQEYAILRRLGGDERIDREWMNRNGFRATDDDSVPVMAGCSCVHCWRERGRVLRLHLVVQNYRGY